MKQRIHDSLESGGTRMPTYMMAMKDDVENHPMTYVGYIMLATSVGTIMYMKLSGMW